MPLLSDIPEAALSVIEALSLRDVLAVRVAGRATQCGWSDALLHVRRLELSHTVQSVPATKAPTFFSGVRFLVLAQGVLPVGGIFGGLAEELEATIALARRLPSATRVDLIQRECTLLLPRTGAPAPPVDEPSTLPHCFACVGTDGSVADEAATWARLLRHGCWDKRSEKGWPLKLAGARAAVCAMAGGGARRYVAHAVDADDEVPQLLRDLSLLTRLRELTLVWWPARRGRGRARVQTPSAASDGNACMRRILAACPGVQVLEERSAGAERASAVNAALRRRTTIREPDIGRSGAVSGSTTRRALPVAVSATPRSAASTRRDAAPRRASPATLRLAGFGRSDAVWSYIGNA
eukprot:NODE_13968_length_1136_cov_2.837463.p1 GENE.NODE_13968_length_1136_cov_2.837463~~NODE_13968_length_1136_cov_2.837463.p1  ORF type:complete len:352 (+),score=76.77 NODE_13968_length_1136_cov_2.837463:78-1133(+)